MRGNSEVSLVSLTLSDVITPDRNQHKVKKETCVPMSADITKTIKVSFSRKWKNTCLILCCPKSSHVNLSELSATGFHPLQL